MSNPVLALSELADALEAAGHERSYANTIYAGIAIQRAKMGARPWRVGRHQPNNVYMQLGDVPDDDDVEIGVFFTPELAVAAVEAYNAALPGFVAHPDSECCCNNCPWGGNHG